MSSEISETYEIPDSGFLLRTKISELVQRVAILRSSCNRTASELAEKVGKKNVFRNPENPPLFREPHFFRGPEIVCRLMTLVVTDENKLGEFCGLIWQYLLDVGNFHKNLADDKNVSDFTSMVTTFRIYYQHSYLKSDKRHRIRGEDHMRKEISKYLGDWIGKPILKATSSPDEFFKVQTRILEDTVRALEHIDANLDSIVLSSDERN